MWIRRILFVLVKITTAMNVVIAPLALPSTDKRSDVCLIFDRINALDPRVLAKYDRYYASESSLIAAAPARKQLIWEGRAEGRLTKKMLDDPGQAVDKAVAAFGWWAVFKEQVASGQTEEAAARFADEAMNRTQQVSRTKDQAELYSEKEILKWMTLFTGPLNKVFNIATHDIIHRPGLGRKMAAGLGITFAGYLG